MIARIWASLPMRTAIVICALLLSGVTVSLSILCALNSDIVEVAFSAPRDYRVLLNISQILSAVGFREWDAVWQAFIKAPCGQWIQMGLAAIPILDWHYSAAIQTLRGFSVMGLVCTFLAISLFPTQRLLGLMGGLLIATFPATWRMGPAASVVWFQLATLILAFRFSARSNPQNIALFAALVPSLSPLGAVFGTVILMIGLRWRSGIPATAARSWAPIIIAVAVGTTLTWVFSRIPIAPLIPFELWVQNGLSIPVTFIVLGFGTWLAFKHTPLRPVFGVAVGSFILGWILGAPGVLGGIILLVTGVMMGLDIYPIRRWHYTVMVMIILLNGAYTFPQIAIHYATETSSGHDRQLMIASQLTRLLNGNTHPKDRLLISSHTALWFPDAGLPLGSVAIIDGPLTYRHLNRVPLIDRRLAPQYRKPVPPDWIIIDQADPMLSIKKRIRHSTQAEYTTAATIVGLLRTGAIPEYRVVTDNGMVLVLHHEGENIEQK
ncbi:hypothetical protein EBR96_06470 [bacterium]|nr:hypothetical protein [bacterium]